MKIHFLLLLLVSTTAFAGSWKYNENSGIGIYQPEGWKYQENGRSSLLTGPDHDSSQSTVFLGSDWNNKIQSLADLQSVIEKQEKQFATAVHFAELDGFHIGTEEEGKYFLLRIPENFIVIEVSMKGSKDQKEEALRAVSSVEIRTKGIEN